MVERRGADATIADNDGKNLLHLLCQYDALPPEPSLEDLYVHDRGLPCMTSIIFLNFLAPSPSVCKICLIANLGHLNTPPPSPSVWTLF